MENQESGRTSLDKDVSGLGPSASAVSPARLKPQENILDLVPRRLSTEIDPRNAEPRYLSPRHLQPVRHSSGVSNVFGGTSPNGILVTRQSFHSDLRARGSRSAYGALLFALDRARAFLGQPAPMSGQIP